MSLFLHFSPSSLIFEGEFFNQWLIVALNLVIFCGNVRFAHPTLVHFFEIVGESFVLPPEKLKKDYKGLQIYIFWTKMIESGNDEDFSKNTL